MLTCFAFQGSTLQVELHNSDPQIQVVLHTNIYQRDLDSIIMMQNNTLNRMLAIVLAYILWHIDLQHIRSP